MLAPVSDSTLAASGGSALASATYGSSSAPVASSGSFSGADVDGLDRVAAECRKGAQVCDEMRVVCEIIVAAASFFGPFGAAFVAYLKGVVIPWLKRISEALNLFAKVLSAHSAAQRDASSSATSLPDYVTPQLPAASTHDYPTLPLTTGSGFAVSIETPQGHAEVVYTPASVDSGTNPFTTSSPGAATATPVTPAAISDPGVPIATPATGPGSPTVAPLGPVHGITTPDGQLGTASAPALGGTAGVPAVSTVATQPSIGSATPSLGGACAPADAPAGSSLADAPGTAGGQASHDGLYSGLGQATGIGAGAAAIAKSALTQARDRGGDSVIGTVLLPADGAADGAVQAQIFGGELG